MAIDRSIGCRESLKNLSIPYPVTGKRTFNDELVETFGCNLLLSMSKRKIGRDLWILRVLNTRPVIQIIYKILTSPCKYSRGANLLTHNTEHPNIDILFIPTSRALVTYQFRRPWRQFEFVTTWPCGYTIFLDFLLPSFPRKDGKICHRSSKYLSEAAKILTQPDISADMVCVRHI